MSKELDQGRIILTKSAPLAVNQLDWLQTKEAGDEAFLNSADEALQLVEDGFQGIDQSELLKDESKISAEALEYTGYPNDEQRTITSDMSLEEVQSLCRAVHHPFSALFRYDGQLYYVLRVTPVTREEFGSLATRLQDVGSGNGGTVDGAQKRIGSNVLQTFRDGILSMAIRKV